MILNGAIATGLWVPSYNGARHLAAITGTTKLVPYQSAKSRDFIWKSGNIRFHLLVPDIQESSGDLISTRVPEY